MQRPRDSCHATCDRVPLAPLQAKLAEMLRPLEVNRILTPPHFVLKETLLQLAVEDEEESPALLWGMFCEELSECWCLAWPCYAASAGVVHKQGPSAVQELSHPEQSLAGAIVKYAL